MQPPSRRTFLSLGLLTLTAACTTDHPGPTPGTTGPRPDPDAPIRLRAIAATDVLLAGYDAQPAPPGARSADLRAENARHRAALAEGLPASALPSPPVTTGPTPTPGTPTPVTPAPAADGLAALELRTAESHLADLDAAGPPLARLLASIAAAHTLHATVLGAPAPPVTARPATSPSAAPTPGAAALTAVQNALGAEHAAVYGYGVVGARLPEDPQRTDARTAYAAHQAQRDTWQRLLNSLGTAPTPAAGGYRLPFPVTSSADAGRLAAHLEARLTSVYADLVAAVPTPHRLTAALALRECALRAHRWGAPDQPFPGIPDRIPTPTATTG
ncbi:MULTISPECIES: ferritin-like domain-containing protein [unclassified Kitasatospora]|uniref:ferritin-like domain-containing protein n=1 Tax=unclassified Kitasatospora TaxID=2633591 RepID=UPI0033EF765D